MDVSLLFWILMLLWAVFGVWSNLPGGNFRGWGGTLLLFVLIGLLGYKVFGAPLHG